MASVVLKRTIDKLGIGVLAINGLIGAGIFALPAGAASLSGSLSPWLFLLCALLMLFVILSFAQLSTGFDQTGGPVLYAKQEFGEHASFQTTWLLYVGRLTALAANSNALVLYLGFLYPPLSEGPLRVICIVAILGFLTLINLYGVTRTMQILKTITLLKLIPLFLFVVLGLSYLEPKQLITFDVPEVFSVEASLLLIVYAFIGFEGALVPAGESKNPTKNIARALISTLAVTALLYFFIQHIALALVPNLSQSEAPLADAAEVFAGSSAGIIIMFAAVISIAGNLSTVIFTAPRMTYALAEQGALPSWFATLSSKSQVPKNAILFLVITAAILATTGTFIWLAIVSSLARLIGYFIAIAALVKIKATLVQEHKWMLPLGLLIPVLALCICAWLALQASALSWGMTLGFMSLGSMLYVVQVKKR